MTLFLSLSDFSDAALSAEEIYSGIFIVRNFLNEDEIKSLLFQFKNMTEEDWTKQYTENIFSFIEEEYGVSTLEEAQALGHNISIDQNWVDKNALILDQKTNQSINERLSKVFKNYPELDFCGAGSIQRQYEGVELAYHVDSLSRPSVALAAVMYVNGDFKGGELHFPAINVRFEPQAGDLIIFPSSDEYLHGVLPVEAGPIRYAIPAFINYREVSTHAT